MAAMATQHWTYFNLISLQSFQDSRGITHTNGNDKTTVSFTWTAPPEGTEEVEVRFAVVMVRQTYWASQLADTLQGTCRHSDRHMQDTHIGLELMS